MDEKHEQDDALVRFGPAVDLLRAALPSLQAVYLFGSQVRERTHGESDVDLAILSSRALSADSRWNLQEELAVLLHADVDLVDLARASTVMRMQVVTTGHVLYEADVNARQRFEMVVLSSYALLNEERAALLDHVYKRGRIYDR